MLTRNALSNRIDIHSVSVSDVRRASAQAGKLYMPISPNRFTCERAARKDGRLAVLRHWHGHNGVANQANTPRAH